MPFFRDKDWATKLQFAEPSNTSPDLDLRFSWEEEEEKRIAEGPRIGPLPPYRPFDPSEALPYPSWEEMVKRAGFRTQVETPGERFVGEWILPLAATSWIPGGLAMWRGLATAPKLAKIGGRILVSPMAGPEKLVEFVGKGALIGIRKGVSSLEQKAEAHRIASMLGMERKAYEQKAREITGKSSMKEMTQEEAELFITSLGNREIVLPYKNMSSQQASKNAKSLGVELSESMGGRKPPKPIVTRETEKISFLQKLAKAKDSYIARAELVDQMIIRADGGKQGKVYQTFINSMDDAVDKVLGNKFRIWDDLKANVDKLGLKLGKMLNQTFEITPGVRITAFERMGLYLHLKNPDNWRHVLKGNFRGLTAKLGAKGAHELLSRIAREVTPEEKQLADWMFAEAQKNTPVLSRVYKEVTGKKFKEVKDYWRIILREFDDIEIDPVIGMFEKEYAKNFPSSGIKKTFVRSRTGKAGQAIELDAMETFLRTVQDVEHYKYVLPLIRDLQRIYRNPSFTSAFKNKMGEARYKVLGNWLEDVASTNPFRMQNPRENFLRMMRANATTGILGLGLPIAFKQLPSFFLGAARIGNGWALGGVVKNLSKGGYKETMQLMKRLAPQMRERVMERELAEMRNAKSLVNQMRGKGSWREWAMILTTTADKIATSSIWRGAFDKGIRQGLDETKAAREALKIVKETQPFFAIKDVPDFWRSGEGFRMLTMFQNQLNRNFNFIWQHLIGGLRTGSISKVEAIKQLSEGIVLPAMLIGIISNSRLPDDPIDFAKSTAHPLTAIFPLIGPIMASAMDGFYETVDPPTFIALEEASQVVYQASKGEWEKAITETPEAVGFATGLPVYGPKRFIRGLIRNAQGKSNDWLELIWGEYIRSKNQRRPKNLPYRR